MGPAVDNPAGRAAVARYVAARDSLIAQSAPTAAAAAAHSAALDDALALLASTAAELAPPARPWAVVALGGYGCGRLLPWSDTDLLIAVEGRPDRYREFVEAMLYPLWDAGLSVGHAVRDRREAAAAAAADVASLTAMATGRLVAGSPDVFERVVVHSAAAARKHPRRPLDELRSRVRPGSPFELWPDLKDGRGGQRDIDELTWTAALLGSEPAWDPKGLVGLGLLSSEESGALEEAGDALTAARWAAHTTHARGDNRFDEDVAARWPGTADAINPAMARVDALTELVRTRVSGLWPPAGAVRGRRGVRHGDEPDRDRAGSSPGPLSMLTTS